MWCQSEQTFIDVQQACAEIDQTRCPKACRQKDKENLTDATPSSVCAINCKKAQALKGKVRMKAVPSPA